MVPLAKRHRQVLYAVVTEFIASGEPVGSRTLARKYGFDLSAATIRMVLADLEDAGYLAQPHTSAGRVPTEAAYRLFIDALMQVRRLAPEESARITEHLEDLAPGADLLRETGKLLSELTGAAAVLVRPRVEARKLLRIRFVPTRPGELLAVLVMADGSVENRFLAIERPPSTSELDRLHNLLEEAASGRTLGELHGHLEALSAARRDELASLQGLGATLLGATRGSAARATEVVVEGRARLFEHPDFRGAEGVQPLLRALEDTERLVVLLERALESERVQVFLGDETSETAGLAVGVVAAPYLDELGRPGGAVAIIGPTRMDYPTVVPLVGATADAMSAALTLTGRGGRGSPPR